MNLNPGNAGCCVEHPPPIAYGPGDIVRKVDSGGLITFRNRPVRVGKAFRGQPVALRPTPDITDPLFHRYTDAELKDMENSPVTLGAVRNREAAAARLKASRIAPRTYLES